MSFDLETILGFLFVIFFVILPVFSKRRKGGQPREPTGQPPSQAGAPAPPRTGAASSASPATSTQRTQRPQPAGGASLQSTLDEIRERVREAQEQESARARGAQASVQRPAAEVRGPTPETGTKLAGSHSRSSADPFGRGMVSGQYSSHGSGAGPAPGSSTGRAQPTSAGTPRPATSAPLGREGRRVSAPIESAAPLEVTKTKRIVRQKRGAQAGGHAPARLKPAADAAKLSSGLLGTTRADLVRGMIWHEVLSEPAAHKRLRRLRSRPR